MTATPQVADDCIACGAVFRSNTDLASLPRGRRVAWDRASGRTWRICTRCGHWNLLGREAGTGLATELASRLPGRTAGGVMHDLVGSVEVVLIADLESGQVRSRAAVKGRKIARWFQNPLAKAALSLPVFIIAVILISSLAGPFQPLATLHQIGFMIVPYLGGAFVARWFLRGKPVNMFALAGLTAGALALVAFPPSWITPVGMGAFLLLLAAAFGLMELFGPPFDPVTLHGKSRRFTPFAARNAALALSPDRTDIVVRALGRRRDIAVHGPAAERALPWLNAMVEPESVLEGFEAGWLLARAHGSSAGLVRELLAIHPDSNGSIRIRDLPPAWRAAFAFTCAESQGDAKEREKLLARIREASDVAAIAERLEKDEGET